MNRKLSRLKQQILAAWQAEQTHDENRLLLCPEHFSTEGRVLHVDALDTIAKYKRFNASFWKDWVKDEYQGRDGRWEIRDGVLWNTVGPNEAAILWYKHEVEGNHAIAFEASAMPADPTQPVEAADQIAELNAIWNGTGATGGPEPWQCTIGSFFGWYVGFSGMEYLYGTPNEKEPYGTVTESKGKYVSKVTELNPCRNYSIFAGRYNDVDFFFIDGMPVMQIEPPMKRPARSKVAIEGFGNAKLASILRFQSVSIYHIPDSAVTPIEFAPEDLMAQMPARLKRVRRAVREKAGK